MPFEHSRPIGLTLAFALMSTGALAPRPAFAQETPPTPPPAAAADPIAALKTKAALSEDERRQLNEWIAARIAVVSSAQPQDATIHQAQQAVRELRDATAGASQGFRETFVAGYADAVRQKLGSMSLSGAAQLMALLASLDEATTAPIMHEALRDQRTAVRAAGATGLRKLRPKIAVIGGDVFTQTVNALREAGRRETAPTVLQAIYEALDYAEVVPSPPDPRALTAALLEVLDARSKLYEGNPIVAEGAELAGLRGLDRLRNNMSDDDKRRYTLMLARMLRHCVLRYYSELHQVRDRTSNPTLVELRNTTELMIQEIEKQLAQLLPTQRRGCGMTAHRMDDRRRRRLDTSC
jgi:hypothetical protein